MAINTSTLKCLFLSLIFISILTSCAEQNHFGESGVLVGKITIGPLCPVETIPPDPGCLPTKETYKAYATTVWELNMKTKLATLDPNLDGTYQIELPAGDYIINFEDTKPNSIVTSNLPSKISIAKGDTTIFNINIDTGIR